MQMWGKIMKIWGLDRRLLREVITGVQWKELQPLFAFADKPRWGKYESVELMTLNVAMLDIISYSSLLISKDVMNWYLEEKLFPYIRLMPLLSKLTLQEIH